MGHAPKGSWDFFQKTPIGQEQGHAQDLAQ